MSRRNDPYDFMSFVNLESNFGQSKGGPKNKSFLDYVSEGDSQLFGDYNSERPLKTKKDKQKIRRNDSSGFGSDLDNFGKQFGMSEEGIGEAIRHGTKARKKRLENYREEKAEKLKARGLTEGKTLGRKLYDELKLRHSKQKTKNQLKKYYHPKEKSLESESTQQEPKLRQAARGYEGYVNEPTLFLTGERGREHVSITPMKKKKNVRQTNDFDLMGGYNNLMKFGESIWF